MPACFCSVQVRSGIVEHDLQNDLSAQVPFPEGYGATVHFFWPGKGFQLLGMCVLIFAMGFILSLTLVQAVKRKAFRHLPPAWYIFVIYRICGPGPLLLLLF